MRLCAKLMTQTLRPETEGIGLLGPMQECLSVRAWHLKATDSRFLISHPHFRGQRDGHFGQNQPTKLACANPLQCEV